MGYSLSEASSAIDSCAPDEAFSVIVDTIFAKELEKETASLNPLTNSAVCKKRESERRMKYNTSYDENFSTNAPVHKKKRSENWMDSDHVQVPNPMIGFSLPCSEITLRIRKIPGLAAGPPYFYFENVALTPKGIWETFRRFLYDINPEFVDSKYLCAAARKRGYIHNLPIHNRFPLEPMPPKTIHEALPHTKKWWPSWDSRTQLNCLRTTVATGKSIERINNLIASIPRSGYTAVERIKQHVIRECRIWNLVWVEQGQIGRLKPNDMELILGFPKDHTISMDNTSRYKSLGNSFQVDTVAYHLSVLKDEYKNGINVLSLFTGIGGAEVALHRLGIPLRVVVSVEASKKSQIVLRDWWNSTGQLGELIEIYDVQELNSPCLDQLICKYNGFDLIIGGSPCNNLTGSNRVTRDGLEGKHSMLFYEYHRIVDMVRSKIEERRMNRERM